MWRDAASRYWAGLTLVCAPAAYLGREWPPWVVRAALWRAGLGVVLGLAVVYVLLTLGPTRQLVASERLTYWRQCPIAPSRWRLFHGVHLTLLHGPALMALGYGLAPAGTAISIGLPVAVAGATIGPLAWRLGHPVAEVRVWSLRWPQPKTRAGTMARVLGLALARRRLAACLGIVVPSLALALLGWVATSHLVAKGEPPEHAAWGFAAASSVLGASAVWKAWPLVRREQWWFDSMGAVGWVPVLASIGLSAASVLPGLVVVAFTATLLPAVDAALLGVSWSLTCVWAGAAAFSLDAAAVRRRDPKVRRDGRFILALALPVILGTWMPVLLLVPAALAVLRARRVGMQAITARRRFELDDIRDDHG